MDTKMCDKMIKTHKPQRECTSGEEETGEVTGDLKYITVFYFLKTFAKANMIVITFIKPV